VISSVHLSDFPTGEAVAVDELLSARMNIVREIASLGRAARMGAKLKIRQPLEKVEVILADRTHQAWLAEHAALLREELNVKQVEFTEKADQYISYTVLPDLKRLGPRIGKRLPALKAALAAADAATLLAKLEAEKQVTLDLPDGTVTLDSDDLQVRLQAKPGWAAAHSRVGVVVLSTDLSETLVAEGLAREVTHAVQGVRRDEKLEFTARIRLGIVTDSKELIGAVKQFAAYIQAETLAVELVFEPLPGVEPVEVTIGDFRVKLYLKVI
jgi:isoleucyl-tRNA synthetase